MPFWGDRIKDSGLALIVLVSTRMQFRAPVPIIAGSCLSVCVGVCVHCVCTSRSHHQVPTTTVMLSIQWYVCTQIFAGASGYHLFPALFCPLSVLWKKNKRHALAEKHPDLWFVMVMRLCSFRSNFNMYPSARYRATRKRCHPVHCPKPYLH